MPRPICLSNGQPYGRDHGVPIASGQHHISMRTVRGRLSSMLRKLCDGPATIAVETELVLRVGHLVVQGNVQVLGITIRRQTVAKAPQAASFFNPKAPQVASSSPPKRHRLLASSTPHQRWQAEVTDIDFFNLCRKVIIIQSHRLLASSTPKAPQVASSSSPPKRHRLLASSTPHQRWQAEVTNTCECDGAN